MGDTPDADIPYIDGGGDSAGGVPVVSMGTRLDEDKYRMDHKKRGLFLLINNRYFDKKTRQKERTGTDVDAANLYALFSGLGFDVRFKNNKTATDMLKIFNDVAIQDHSNSDCFVCAILSHGDTGLVYGTDGIVKIDIIASFFKGSNCPTLNCKPKFFIIQACRGHELDGGAEVADALGEHPEQKIYRIPEMADFLYAYSTAPGYYSWRNSTKGSWFIQAFCKVFKGEYGDTTDRDILTLLTRVNRTVAYDYESHSSLEGFNSKKQVPSIVSMLTKQLYL